MSDNKATRCLPPQVSQEATTWPGGRPLPQDSEALLLPIEAAYCLGVSPRSLEAWRVRGGGPPYLKISARAVRYQRGALFAWATDRHRQSTTGQ